MGGPYKLGEHKIKWHGTLVHRLRLVSFVAEQFWKVAFKERRGLNSLAWDSVKTVWLNDVQVDGVRKRGEVEVEVPEEWARLALEVARAAVVLLEQLFYRILDVVVRGPTGEHDLIAEGRGLSGLSSVEVKCRTIKSPQTQLVNFRDQLRRDALKLWDPDRLSERIVVMFEFADGSKDESWRILRCEAYNGSVWKSLLGWGGAQRASLDAAGTGPKRGADAPAIAPKRRKTASSATANSSTEKWVLLAGAKYSTLPWYLGREAVKSQVQAACRSCADGRVALRGGDWKTLAPHWGQEVLGEAAIARFQDHCWVDTLCSQPRRGRGRLQVRLMRGGAQPSSNKYMVAFGKTRHRA